MRPTTNMRAPISHTPSVRANRSAINHVPHPLVRVPAERTPSVQVYRSTVDQVSLPQGAQRDHAVVIQLLRGNQDLRNAAQQSANAEAMRNMKNDQAQRDKVQHQRDEVRCKVILDLQAVVSAIGNRRGVSVMQRTATMSGGRQKTLWVVLYPIMGMVDLLYMRWRIVSIRSVQVRR
jgi:hypothetical protein